MGGYVHGVLWFRPRLCRRVYQPGFYPVERGRLWRWRVRWIGVRFTRTLKQPTVRGAATPSRSSVVTVVALDSAHTAVSYPRRQATLYQTLYKTCLQQNVMLTHTIGSREEAVVDHHNWYDAHCQDLCFRGRGCPLDESHHWRTKELEIVCTNWQTRLPSARIDK